MLMDLLIWWVQQMKDLLPDRLFAQARYTDALVARFSAGEMLLFSRRRGVEMLLGKPDQENRVRGRAAATILRLDAGAMLEQEATLPLISERDLGAVLRHEMDRFTPFRAEDLFWTWRVERRDRQNGLLSLRLLLVPKSGIQASLTTMAASGLRPVALEIPTSSGVEHLLLAGPDARSGSHRSALIASWACAGLAVAVFVVPVIQQEWAISRAVSTVDSLRPRVALVDALRRRIAANTSGTDVFSAENAKVGNPLRALAAITAALPDDTYLTAFTMRERKISIAGRSAGAARLISALSSDPELRDPTFDAPITRAGDRVDLFSIQVRLAP